MKKGTLGICSLLVLSLAGCTLSNNSTNPEPPTTQHEVMLSWTTSSSPVVGYKVYRGTQSGGPYSLLSTDLLTADSFVDATVTSGHTYFYVVTAVSDSGMESVFSNQGVAVVPSS